MEENNDPITNVNGTASTVDLSTAFTEARELVVDYASGGSDSESSDSSESSSDSSDDSVDSEPDSPASNPPPHSEM